MKSRAAKKTWLWARFTDADGVDWEVAYDAETRTMSYNVRN